MYWAILINRGDFFFFGLEEISGRWFKPLGGPIHWVYWACLARSPLSGTTSLQVCVEGHTVSATRSMEFRTGFIWTSTDCIFFSVLNDCLLHPLKQRQSSIFPFGHQNFPGKSINNVVIGHLPLPLSRIKPSKQDKWQIEVRSVQEPWRSKNSESHHWRGSGCRATQHVPRWADRCARVRSHVPIPAGTFLPPLSAMLQETTFPPSGKLSGRTMHHLLVSVVLLSHVRGFLSGSSFFELFAICLRR